MQTVREWAALRGFTYEFVDDALFDYAPPQLRALPRNSILPLTDVARLGLLRARLASDYERALWIDADVVIFRPEQLLVADDGGAMLCHQIWSSQDAQQRLVHRKGINNAFMMFRRDHPLLGFLHYSAVQLYGHYDSATMPPTAIGTTFLTKLGTLLPIRLMPNVACLSPMLVSALVHGTNTEWLTEHATQFGQPFYATNLCHSMLSEGEEIAPHREKFSDAQLTTMVETLMHTRGRQLFSRDA